MTYTRYTASCLLCKSEVASTMLDRHYNTKQCRSGGKFAFDKLECCPHCNINLDEITSDRGNHVRWCKENPRRNHTKTSRSTAQMNTKEAMEKKVIKIKQAHADGRYKDAPKKGVETLRARFVDGIIKHTEESIEKIRIAANNSNHQRKCKRSHKFVDKKGREFTFDSSWEDLLAIRLDDLDIAWIRPAPIPYEIDGRTRKYFPDFFLPDHDLFIDPKNPYVKRKQERKLEIVSKMINLLVIDTRKGCIDFTI